MREWKRYCDRLNERDRRFKDSSQLCVLGGWNGTSYQGWVAGIDLREAECPHLCVFELPLSLYNKKAYAMRIEKRRDLTFNAKTGIIKENRSLEKIKRENQRKQRGFQVLGVKHYR